MQQSLFENINQLNKSNGYERPKQKIKIKQTNIIKEGKNAGKIEPKLKQSDKFKADKAMEPHSEAKVRLYTKYLEKYLVILCNSRYIHKIHIYDVFCGSGIYANGKVGSPIAAFYVIQKIREFFKGISNKNVQNALSKAISLVVNDNVEKSVERVKDFLNRHNNQNSCCKLDFYNYDAGKMLHMISGIIMKQKPTERNLVFIDPTGYRDIHKNDLLNSLHSDRREIILFLPISFMYRFKDTAQKDFNNPSYIKLRQLINEFFEETHPIRQDIAMNVFDFIGYIREALKFSKYYTTSFYIQRDQANYYALFFITPKFIGLTRIIDAKWKMDKLRGEGYNIDFQPDQIKLFLDQDEKILQSRIDELEMALMTYIQNNPECSNCNICHFIYTQGFLPKHATKILKKWKDSKILEIWDVVEQKPFNSNGFYITDKDCETIKVTYKFVK